MTRHIKSVDRRHLASVGDEGFFCDQPGHEDWTRNCGEGVDTVALTKLPAVDLMSFHIYPDRLGQGPAVDLRLDHPARARGQRGSASRCCGASSAGSTRPPATPSTSSGPTCSTTPAATGWLYWILSGVQDDGTLYPDYDGFTVYCPSPVCTTLSNAGEELRGPQRSRPPVADHDTAVAEFNQTATLTPAANDVAYRTRLQAGLDRPRPGHGRPAAHAHRGGWHVRPRQRWRGDVHAGDRTSSARRSPATTIQDEAGRWSNVAELSVTVKPDPTAAISDRDVRDRNRGLGPRQLAARRGHADPDGRLPPAGRSTACTST